MEQALSIDPDRTKEIEDIPQCLTNINFVQICGPIVEIEDEKLQFVHFTAEEYVHANGSVHSLYDQQWILVDNDLDMPSVHK